MWIALEVVPGVIFDGRFVDLLLLAVVFGAVNTFIRPIAKLLTLPVRAVTLGLFTLVVNGAMLLLAAWLTKTLGFEGGFVSQLGSATLTAIVISVVSTVLSWVLPDGR